MPSLFLMCHNSFQMSFIRNGTEAIKSEVAGVGYDGAK
ncbi:hypothetical protein POKO110462_05400 [Pontibacter korlensis]